jgi:Fuc2NAc and GlcNAc transferase
VQVTSLLLIYYVLIAALAWFLTKAAIRWVTQLGMQDIPGERSSHSVPTPRGGGIVICALLFAFAAIALWSMRGSARWMLAVVLGGGLVALIGWIDDRKSVSAAVRFSVHLLAAITVVAAMGTTSTLEVLPGITFSGLLAAGFVVLFITWMINLYNFMDGIDGLAGGQAATVAFGIFMIARQHANTPLALLALTLSSAAFGFLLVNWHPAKVFMGDVGSGFIGFIIGLLAVWGAVERSIPFSSSLVLMAYFVVDATWTMLRRGFGGERIWQAHRDHAYQHAVRAGWSHAQVSGAVIAMNLLLLFPAAVAINSSRAVQWPVLLLPYLGVLGLVLRYRAGVRIP